MSEATDPLINSSIGSYKVTSKIGLGGMGAVYLAVHPMIGKRVAVKVLHSEFAEKQDVVQRFLQEAKAVSALHHINIVEVIDFGQLGATQGNLFYCVMELLEGEVLRDRMKAGPMTEAQAVSIASQIAAGVTAAHQKRIIHRDLKPENVFLTGANHDVVKILDFGIAKLTGEGQASMQTQAGMLLGTPSYMSPEQCLARPVDARTDVYALGVILFEMCTGRLPFIGEGYADLLIKQINGDLPPPRSINPALSEGIEWVIMRAMEKDPNNRFQSMEEFERELAVPTTAEPAAFSPSGDPDQTVLSGSNGAATIQGMVSEFHSGTGSHPGVPAARKSSVGALLGIGALLIAAAGAGAFVLLRDDGKGGSSGISAAGGGDVTPSAEPPQPVVPPPAVGPKKVHLHVSSEPAGASVKRDDDGTSLGVTPLDTELQAGTMLKLTVHKDGFKDETRAIVVGERDKTLSLQLTVDAPPKPVHHSSSSHGKPEHPATNLGDDILRPSL